MTGGRAEVLALGRWLTGHNEREERQEAMKDENEVQRWRNGGRDAMTKRRMDETRRRGETGGQSS